MWNEWYEIPSEECYETYSPRHQLPSIISKKAYKRYWITRVTLEFIFIVVKTVLISFRYVKGDEVTCWTKKCGR